MEQVTIEILGQACTLIDAGDVVLLSDPWFSGTSQLGSWIPCPAWRGEELEDIRCKLARATHIYLSHDHDDHFDPAFLKSLPHMQIVVGDFCNGRMKAALKELSEQHTIVFLKDKEIVQLAPNVEAQILMEQPPFRTNSILVLKTLHGTILNANDCAISGAMMREVSKRYRIAVFLYTLNFMANGYPFPYLRKNSNEILARRIGEVRKFYIDSFATALKLLKPALSVAFAGPIRYADRVNDHLNEHPESTDWTSIVKEVGKEHSVVWPAPFSSIVLGNGEVISASINQWAKYLERPAEAAPNPELRALEARPTPTADEFLNVANTFAKNLSSILLETGRRVKTALVFSSVESFDALESEMYGWNLKVQLDPDSPEVAFYAADAFNPPYLQMISTDRVLYGFLTNVFTLDNLLLSSRARFTRDPDVFDSVLHDLLKFGRDSLSRKALQDWMMRRHADPARETLCIEFEGRKTVIPKYCPHEGESFEYATIRDGRIICSRHRWVFDLDTGQCLDGDRSVNLHSLLGNRSGDDNPEGC